MYKLAQRKGRCVQVSFDDGKTWRSTGCKTKEEAERKLADVSNIITLKNYAKNFYDANCVGSIHWRDIAYGVEKKTGTYTKNNSYLQNYIIPKWGEYLLTDIKSNEVENWLLGLRNVSKDTPVSPEVKSTIIFIMKDIFNRATVDGYLKENTIKYITIPKKKQRRRTFLTPEELSILFPDDDEKLIEVFGDLAHACYFSIMKDTGFRPCEVLALNKNDFDFEKNTVFTEKEVDNYLGKIENRIKTSDTGQSYKIGLISEQTKRLLKEYFNTAQDVLFYKQKYFNYVNSINNYFKNVCKHNIGREAVQYELRHSFMTNLIGKLPKEVIMEFMGHTKWEDCYDNRTSEMVIEQFLKNFNSIRG